MAGEWRKVSFSSLCDITRGASPRPIHDWIVPKGIPWVKISDASAASAAGSRFIEKTGDCIHYEGRSKSVSVFPGDLILSNSATPGIPMFMRIEACIHDGWLLLRNLRGLDKLFAYYLLLHERPALVNQGNGSVFTNLKTEILKNHVVPLPPLPEQRAIAHILGTLDDKIELNRRMNETLEGMARALFQSWFVDFDPVRAKAEGRDPGLPKDLADLFPDSFEDSELGEIPKGWRVKTAEEVSTVGIGKTPPRKEHQWFSENPEDVPWMSIRDLGNAGVFISHTSEFLTSEAVEKFRVRRIPDNTVVLSFKLTIGRIAITDGEMLSNEAIAHFRLHPDIPFGLFYLYCYLKGFSYDQLGSTSSIATAINSDMVRGIRVLVPPSDVAKPFEQRVAPLFGQIKNLQKQSRTLAALRDALLPKLISGELRVG